MRSRLLLLGILSFLLGLAVVKTGIFAPNVGFSPPVSASMAAQVAATLLPGTSLLDGAKRAHADWAERAFPSQDPAEIRMLALLTALAIGPSPPAPDWPTLLQEERISRPHFCVGVVRILRALPEFPTAAAIRPLDDWRTPAELRAEVLHTLWEWDVMEGFNRCRQFFLKERTRAQDRVRALVVERVLRVHKDPRATELLITVATRPRVEERARRLAIRALVERSCRESAPFLDALFRSEDTNSLLRRTAFSAMAELDPNLARRTLLELNRDPKLEFNLRSFLDQWRTKLDVPLPKRAGP